MQRERSPALAVIDQAGRARLIGCDACLPASELASLARRRATRPLTAAERARYLHE